ncbi:hypothetical protein GGR53DRAFT_491482 [Hypoxylon sp. FL1150]|nr:hypothetical protein GGR53DRAFT_491482 [Hypoxylon sp. FL1150]
MRRLGIRNSLIMAIRSFLVVSILAASRHYRPGTVLDTLNILGVFVDMTTWIDADLHIFSTANGYFPGSRKLR